jgi:hypothetical protein
MERKKMMNLNDVSGSFEALQQLYTKKNGTQANADELVSYARMQQDNIFNVWDKLAVGDNADGTAISSNKHYANNKDLFFQSNDGQILNFDLDNGIVDQATNKQLAQKLDIYDDRLINTSVTPNALENSNINIGSDKMDIYQANNLKSPEVATKDYNSSKITISSEDVSNILTSSAVSGGFSNMNEFVNAATNDQTVMNNYKQTISDFLTDSFGGNKDNVLKNLADVKQLPSSQEMLDELYGQVINKVSANVINSYEDNSTSNDDVSFLKGEISPTAINFDDLKAAINENTAPKNKLETLTNVELQAMWDNGNRDAGLGDEIHNRYNAGDISMHDPIGFEQNNFRYDFIEDKNNDGKFTNINEFLGANTGWAELLKYDENNDGFVKGNELNNLKTLVTDSTTGKAKTWTAADAGISQIDIDSYRAVNQKKKDGNFLAGLFDVIFNNSKIEAEQTYDTDEYLKNTYSQAFGIDLAA